MYHIKQMVQSGKSSKQPLHQLAAPAFVFKPDAEEHIVNLYPEIRYQRIIGFGQHARADPPGVHPRVF